MDAKSVVVAEGPGHQRDTQLVLSQSGFEQLLPDQRIRFVDLNRDELIRTPLYARYTGMKYLWLRRTLLEADFIVSMPKIKTHHWSGVTLSMKNVRRRAWFKIRMAEEYSPLEGYSGKHSRYLCDGFTL